MSAAATRSVFRSMSAARSSAARLAGGAKPKAARSPFRITTQKPLSSRIFRDEVRLRRFVASVSHCYCLCIAHFNALRHSSLLRLDS
ncbi:hypothetical protein LOK49_LG09G01951 [Camellia lanceoleosa]|uniref:Uncharacterized protein n=1 Tax=Camellia lanceoleosa TaxID=1840588 RepID=A0ACC0GPC5_9ERIC|nr:hypothetical protein LOK49_LG09G01951 [Camellia lanceoleosa]